MFTTATAVAALALLPLAANGAVHQVTVGGPGGVIAYNPNFITADPGDTVIFTFQQKNHTATQSSFNDPCSALEGGFDSGFLPVGDDVTSDFPVAQLTVEDTNPIWVYCRQTGHCEQGMVFAVNPGENFGAFQAKANGTSSATSSASSTATGAASVVTVTATVTVSDGDIVTTTYGSYPGSAEPTSASSSDHLITVGGSSGELTFSPSNISAQVGDTITFQFHQKNHTATQSSFADPCRALSLTSTSGQVGFDSGFMAVAADASTFPTYTVAVNDTTPIWVYCRQTGHCGQGMVFSANAIESGPNNFAAFQAKAKQLNGTSTSSSQSSTSVSPSATTSTTSSAVSTFVNHNGFALGVIALVFGLVL